VGGRTYFNTEGAVRYPLNQQQSELLRWITPRFSGTQDELQDLGTP